MKVNQEASTRVFLTDQAHVNRAVFFVTSNK